VKFRAAVLYQMQASPSPLHLINPHTYLSPGTVTTCHLQPWCINTIDMVAGWSLALNEYCVIDFLIEIFGAQQPIWGLSYLTVKVSRSHAVMHTYPIELLCTSDRPISEAATYTTHNKQKRRMPSAGFETTVPTVSRLQTFTLDCTATGISFSLLRTLIQLIGAINCE
jgi:hypothetical protein